MIHTLLNLTRNCFVLDTETTGVNPDTDHIVEIGFQQYDAAGMVKEWHSLINPGVPIPAGASAVHHITDEDFKKCRTCGVRLDAHPVGKVSETIDAACITPSAWPTFKQLAPNLAKGLVDCDFAGQSVRFDLRLLTAEFKRAGVAWSYAGARIIDSLQLERLAYPRDLGSLHERYTGAKHDGAHGAMSDVRASVAVIAKQLEMHSVLPRDLDQLHELSWPGWIDNDGKFRFVDGVPCFSQWGKYANRPMREADSGYWDFILSKDFGAEVKALAAAAKLKKFPEAKK